MISELKICTVLLAVCRWLLFVCVERPRTIVPVFISWSGWLGAFGFPNGRPKMLEKVHFDPTKMRLLSQSLSRA
jgi:hypothetical protein